MNSLNASSLQSLQESDRSNESLLAESLQLDVEDLDDTEYAIPRISELPTLEAVLSSEYELDSDIGSELNMPVLVQAPTPTPSIAEDGGVRVGDICGGGSIMRYAMLQGVSAQVASAVDRINAGLATACVVASQIAIGTSHGHILNFDITQTLRWAYQEKNGQGAVTTLAFNPEGTRLLAGYARGLLQMFDTQSGDVLRSMNDVITPNTGILHVKWTSRSALALCADSGGSVWSLSFTRKLGIRSCTSRCLFSGARGEVCAMEPLIMDSTGGSGSELDQYCIVALATLSKYFIVTIRPRLKVVKYHALNGPADCLPVLAWQMVLIQAADNTRSVDPVIVVGRGQQLFFHQLFVANGRISLLYLRYVQLQANLLSAHWLGPKHVTCMDTMEILHLIDVRTCKELECFDMANAGLVYGSAQFKGLATGGNVSPALALAGTHACYNSMSSRGSQLYILGARSLHMIGVRNWNDRISYLVKNQRWQEACDLALQGYRAANCSLTSRPKRKIQAKDRILLLFKEYLSASARAPEYCLTAIVNCLIAADELELLWTQLWDKLTESNRKIFLEVISEHIENGDILSVNPIISQALVEHWLYIYPAKLEELILKLEWTCLDLNQVMKAAKRHKLYRAQIYLNTQALNDYTVTLTELIPQLQHALDNDTVVPTDLGNCLLVYVSSCLAGRGYPAGDIPPEHIQHVKHEVLRCLTASRSKHVQNEPQTNGLPYPYLRALLQFDTRETLNVISLAFEEREFNGDQGQAQRKRIINTLLQIMTPENTTWSQIGCLLNFIAQQISQQCLPRDPQLLHTVLNYLATERIANESTRQHAERETAWHELLVNNCLDGITSDDEQLQLAKRANCYYVVEYLLEKLKRYEHILNCYLECKERQETSFSYIEQHLEKPERKIYEQLRLCLAQLLNINATETARIINKYYIAQLDDLIEKLDNANNEQSACYRLLLELHKQEAQLQTKHCVRLLQLLCQQQAKSNMVLDFLQCGRVLNCLEPERALAIVSAHALPEVSIYLHEQLKQYKQAFELYLQLLQNASETLVQTEHRLQQITALCSRACKHNEENRSLWLQLLREVLPRTDLKHLTKTLLHECSQHVDLQQLVQLIMQMQKMSGSFGDIKTLLMDMLSHARSEQRAMASSVQLLGKQMHFLFAQQQRKVRRGLYVTCLHCVICQQRLHNQLEDILIPGTCAHPMHENCAKKAFGNLSDNTEIHCQRCQQDLPKNMLVSTMELSTPITVASIASNTISDDTSQNMLAYVGNTVAPSLPLKATPIRYH